MMSIKKIKQVVEELLEVNRITRPPVPVEKIASSLGATIRYEPFAEEKEDVSGMVFRFGNRAIIGVNSLHSPVRQRFTIAHELGHILLPRGDEIHVDRGFNVYVYRRDQRASEAVDRHEISANRFAAELLMPERMVRSEVEQLVKEPRIDREEFMDRLSKIFNVSIEALAFRLRNLGYEIE